MVDQSQMQDPQTMVCDDGRCPWCGNGLLDLYVRFQLNGDNFIFRCPWCQGEIRVIALHEPRFLCYRKGQE